MAPGDKLAVMWAKRSRDKPVGLRPRACEAPRVEERAPGRGLLHPLMQLQRAIGNRAMGELLDQARSSDVPPVLHAVLGTQARHRAADAPVQRPGTHAPATVVPSSVEETMRQPGQPMDSTTRAGAEQALGFDFGRVRIHAGSADADRSARAIGAQAYTVGSNIVFADGQYAPSTERGRDLLFHELAHVMQQRPWATTPAGPLQLGAPGSPHEREADGLGSAAAAGAAMAPRTGAALPPNVVSRSTRDDAQRRSPSAHGGLPSPTAYDGDRKDWILERFQRGQRQFQVYIDPNVESSVGSAGAREVVEDLNSALQRIKSHMHFTIVPTTGPETIHIGSAYGVYNKDTTPVFGKSEGPQPSKGPYEQEPFSLVFPRLDTRTGSDFALERSRDAYKNTLMHELLHQLGVGHAYTWIGKGKDTRSTYDVSGAETQMVGDTESAAPKDTRDRMYRGVPTLDLNQLKALYGQRKKHGAPP